jgi:hypothetical protein
MDSSFFLGTLYLKFIYIYKNTKFKFKLKFEASNKDEKTFGYLVLNSAII